MNEDKNVVLSKYFRLEIDKISIGYFEECEVSSSTHNLVENRVGPTPDLADITTGSHPVQTITLGKKVRDLDKAVIKELQDWHKLGSDDKRGGAVDFMKKGGEVYERWEWQDGICSEVTPPRGDASSDDEAKWTFVITAPIVESAL